MNFRPRRNESPEVNITPLIDVVFLLLIFFMVSTTFRHHFEISLDLPRASSEQPAAPAKVELAIDAEGHYYLDGRRLVNQRLETLERALARIAEADPKTPLVIAADGRTPHQAVITAMDAARRAGLTRLTFATRALDD